SDFLEALLNRIADVAEADEFGGFVGDDLRERRAGTAAAVADLPQEGEIADELGEAGHDVGGAGAEQLAEQLGAEADLEAKGGSRLGRNAGVEADVAELGEAEALAVLAAERVAGAVVL